MTQKFKVGDKVRVINPIHSVVYNGYNVGDVFKISDVFSESIETVDGPRLWHREVEKVSKKNERISALEAQVAELIAKVEALEKVIKPKYTLNELLAQVPKSTNEQRKAIIAEAKAFVEDTQKRSYYVGDTPKITHFTESVFFGESDELQFVVNVEKRTVVSIIRTIREKDILHKGIAKCAPDDVFNAEIGKAIALGRALGLDVKRFEQAVKPTDVVAGMVAKCLNNGEKEYVVTIASGRSGYIHSEDCLRRKPDRLVAILDDTDAQY